MFWVVVVIDFVIDCIVGVCVEVVGGVFYLGMWLVMWSVGVVV